MLYNEDIILYHWWYKDGSSLRAADPENILHWALDESCIFIKEVKDLIEFKLWFINEYFVELI